MHKYSLTLLGNRELLRSHDAVLARGCGVTAEDLAHIAEIDARKLYLEEGFPSMYDYCLQHMHLSEDSACKRIRAARAARRFPAIFEALAAGRLHLSAVVLLAPRLTEETADELLAAAAHKSRAEVEQLLAERFPRPDLPARVEALTPSPAPPFGLLAGESAESSAPGRMEGWVNSSAPGRMETPRSKVTPLAPDRFALQATIDGSTHENLEYARALIGHHLPASEIPAVLARALAAYVGQLEKARFAATFRPRSGRHHVSANPRHVPAEVKRTVWVRDGGQCTFVSESGRRCPARSRLEIDHIQPVARGGEATVANLRLVCRGHNQYEAERTFGAGFMSEKREAALRAAEARRQEAAQAAEAAEARRQETATQSVDVAEVPPRDAGERATEAARRASEARREESGTQAAEAVQRSAEAPRQEAAAQAAEVATVPPQDTTELVTEAAWRSTEAWRQESAAQAAEAARRAEEAHRQELSARRKAQEARVRAAVEEIVTPLRILGCRKEEARRIAATCAAIADAPLEERLRFAIRQLAPPHRTVSAAR